MKTASLGEGLKSEIGSNESSSFNLDFAFVSFSSYYTLLNNLADFWGRFKEHDIDFLVSINDGLTVYVAEVRADLLSAGK